MKKIQRILIQTTLLFGLAYVPMSFAQSWEQLPSDAQETLRPLKATWEDLSDKQKKGWHKQVPALQNLPKEKLATAQTRMAEWSALSQKQRQQVQEQLRQSAEVNPSLRARLWRSFTGQ